MGVMRAVLGDPPAEAHPDQDIAHRQPEESVRPPGAKDLVMAGVVPDEAELCEGQPEKAAMPSTHHELPMSTTPANPARTPPRSEES